MYYDWYYEYDSSLLNIVGGLISSEAQGVFSTFSIWPRLQFMLPTSVYNFLKRIHSNIEYRYSFFQSNLKIYTFSYTFFIQNEN